MNNEGNVNLEEYSSLLNAFSHWTYEYTKEYLIVTDLQGFVYKNNEFILTDPAIICSKEPEKYVVENDYNIKKKTYAPSVFGANNLKFSLKYDILIENVNDYMTVIEREMNSKLCPNGYKYKILLINYCCFINFCSLVPMAPKEPSYYSLKVKKN